MMDYDAILRVLQITSVRLANIDDIDEMCTSTQQHAEMVEYLLKSELSNPDYINKEVKDLLTRHRDLMSRVADTFDIGNIEHTEYTFNVFQEILFEYILKEQLQIED